MSRLIVPYLDGEVTPSERWLIQAHLAGCASCQREQAELAGTRDLLAESLKIRAVQAAPSPQALGRLQARLADDAQRSSRRLTWWKRRSAPDALATRSHSSGGILVKRRLVPVVLASVLVVGVMAATIPGVAAQVQQVQQVVVGVVKTGPSVFGLFTAPPPPFDKPDPGSGAATVTGIGSVTAIQTDGTLNASGEELYQKSDQFLVVKWAKAGEDAALPEGQATTVDGHPAVLQTGLSGEYRQAVPAPAASGGTFRTAKGEGAKSEVVTSVEGESSSGSQPAEPPTPVVIQYANANQLVWIVDGVRYEALSNLQVDELLKAAAAVSAPR